MEIAFLLPGQERWVPVSGGVRYDYCSERGEYFSCVARTAEAAQAVFERQGRLWVNVKAEPAWGDFWKQTYPAVVPAYHMNKRHWIGIVLDGSMTADQIFDLIAESYRLTAPRAAKSR